MSDQEGVSATPADQVPYEDDDDPAWDDRALELVRNNALQLESFAPDGPDGVVSVRVSGACPRCRHDLDVRRTLTAPLLRTAWRSLLGGHASTAPQLPGPHLVDVACGCGRAHPQAPGAMRGCGVAFRMPLSLPAAGVGDD